MMGGGEGGWAGVLTWKVLERSVAGLVDWGLEDGGCDSVPTCIPKPQARKKRQGKRMRSRTVRRAPSSTRMTPTSGRTSCLRVRLRSPRLPHLLCGGPAVGPRWTPFLPHQMAAAMRTLRTTPWVPGMKTPSPAVIWGPCGAAEGCGAPAGQEWSLEFSFRPSGAESYENEDEEMPQPVARTAGSVRMVRLMLGGVCLGWGGGI